MNETPRPEQAFSPEQQTVADLCAIVTSTLDAQDAKHQALEDGGYRREVKVDPAFGPSLVEITTPNGTKSYEYASMFAQAHDRGLMTWRWQEGGKAVDYTGDFEVEGKTSRAIEDEAGLRRVKSEVESIASHQLPEKASRQRGRFKRTLGRLVARH